MPVVRRKGMVYTSMYRPKGKPKGKRKNGSPEHDIQVQLVDYLEDKVPTALYSATVGGVRVAMHTALRMKRAGYKKGIPDLLIFEPRNGYVGLALEVKTKTGRASEHQLKWQKELQERGWKAEIRKGLEQCLEAIDEYFGESDSVL